MSEDCLYLHITAPKNASKLPVMVWLHGGGFSILTSSVPGYNNPASLPTKGVVLVSINHRLGVFGYLAHPLLTAESGYNGSGNYGQLDLVRALTWIKENISAFGGDPSNVTIFGESGGGGKVLSLLASPLAKGLFHKAICQSGMYAPDTTSLSTAESVGTRLMQELKVTTLAEMRAKPWTEVELAYRNILANPAPNVDNYYHPKTVRATYEAGEANDVPLINGANKRDLAPLIAAYKLYMPWYANNKRANTYAYIFDYAPATWRAAGAGAFHGIELAYLFNSLDLLQSMFRLGLSGLSSWIDPDWRNPTDLIVIDYMLTAWTNFAKTGDPSTTNVKWDPYTSTNDKYLYITESPSMRTGINTGF